MGHNICIVRPPGYTHSAAFDELATLIRCGLGDLGIHVTLGINSIAPSARNIVIGCHLLDPAWASRLPASTIILNTEQVQGPGPGLAQGSRPDARPIWDMRIIDWLSRFESWDYSVRNIECLRRLGVPSVRLLRIGYHPALARIARAVEQDIDVLFYGSFSARRHATLAELERHGIAVCRAFDCYGAERDALIARSKVVLNLHLMPTQIFETIRVFYLMTNAKAVVCEVNRGTSLTDGYREGIIAVPYEGLVDACRRVVADAPLRSRIEAQAHATIRKMPQAEIMRELVDG